MEKETQKAFDLYLARYRLKGIKAFESREEERFWLLVFFSSREEKNNGKPYWQFSIFQW